MPYPELKHLTRPAQVTGLLKKFVRPTSFRRIWSVRGQRCRGFESGGRHVKPFADYTEDHEWPRQERSKRQ